MLRPHTILKIIGLCKILYVAIDNGKGKTLHINEKLKLYLLQIPRDPL